MKTFLIYLIGKYQKYISPHLQRCGVCCIYDTSCSNYAVESLNVHPLPKAIFLSACRFASCNPVTAYFGQRKYKQLATLIDAKEAGTEEKIKELEEEIKKLKPTKKTSKGTWGCLAVGCVLVVIFVIWSTSQPSSTPSNNSNNLNTDLDLKVSHNYSGVNIKNLEDTALSGCIVQINPSTFSAEFETRQYFTLLPAKEKLISFKSITKKNGTFFNSDIYSINKISIVCGWDSKNLRYWFGGPSNN